MGNGISDQQIADFLSHTNVFRYLSPEILSDIAKNLETIHLSAGTVLINQHEVADSLYIVMYGRLNVIKIRNNKEVVIGELGAGSLVGEIAILVKQTRQATITAVRDSVVLKMSREVFDMLINKHPMAMMGIVRECVDRLLKAESESFKKNVHLTNLVIAPAGDSEYFKIFGQELAALLSTKGPTLYLTKQKYDELFGEGASSLSFQSHRSMSLVNQLNELESKYHHVVFVTDPDLTTWTLRCLALADRLLLVGKNTDHPHLGAIETKIFGRFSNFNALTNLILLHDQKTMRVNIKDEWLLPRKVDQYFNLQVGSIPDLEKLIRIIDGQGIGLVLSGGAARGLAHVGVLRAFSEAKIPIDYICGSSMGALVAAVYCLDASHDGAYRMFKEYLPQIVRGIDYTLPFTSLLSGKKFVRILQHVFGQNFQIENLWEKYFCISTNITKGKLKVHDDGVLWKAIRASISLPGVFPPVQDVDGNLLVDGGILNNLPVDIMRDKLGGGRVIASDISSPHEDARYHMRDDYLSGWTTLLSKIRNFVPNIGNVLMSSMLISSQNHLKQMLLNADCHIAVNPGDHSWFAFEKYEEIVEYGYQAATKVITNNHLFSNPPK